VKTQRIDHLSHVFMFPNGNAVQVVRWTGQRIHLAAADVASAATPLPTGSKILELRAGEDCYVRFGDDAVEASQDGDSDFYPRGVQTIAVPLDANLQPYTHVSVIRAGVDNGVFQAMKIY